MIGPIEFKKAEGQEELTAQDIARQLPDRLQYLFGMSIGEHDKKLTQSFCSTPYPELLSLVEVGCVEITPPLTVRRELTMDEVTITELGNEVAVACRGLETLPEFVKDAIRAQDVRHN